MAIFVDLNILIICLTVSVCFNVIKGINQYGIGVCSGNNNGTKDWYYYCCFNFYLRNGKCTECENGTVSQDGISCTNCSGNTYGHQCKFRCSCLPAQRCDHRLGCVNNDSHIISTEAGAEVTVNEEIIDNETSATTLQTANKETISTTIQSASSNTTDFYYALAGGMMGLSVLCAICSIIFKKRSHTRIQQHQHRSQQAVMNEILQPPNRPSVPAALPPLPRNSRHLYEAVDF